jgi:hypothetical protein
LAATLVAATMAACADGNRNVTDAEDAPAASISATEAEALLMRVVLAPEDVGEGMREGTARLQTNDELAHARADTAFALDQYAAWGQVLSYAVQYDAATPRRLIDTGKFTRVSNTATVFQDVEGARTQLIYVRAQSEERLANAVTNDGAGTRIVDPQVTKDLPFPMKGDESFAWRISGKATFESGITLTFISDTVFVRAGNISGAVTAVALGNPPDRAALERLVDRFVEKARAERAAGTP